MAIILVGDSVSGGTRPNSPSNVTAEALSSTSIGVSWDGVSDALIYKVYRSNSATGTSYTLAGSSTTTSFTDTGLSPSSSYNYNYYYKVSAVNSVGESPQSDYVSARTMSEAEDTTIEGVYVGIISFAGDAKDLMTRSLVRLDESGRRILVSQLSSDYTIATQSGTALFYAVHTALANLKSREDRYPSDLDSVNVITFTDGLDNGSTGMSMLTPIEDKTFSTDDAYTAYLSGEIAGRTIAGKPVTAYSVGVMGSDVSNTAKFTSDLANLAGTGKSQTLTDFESLQTTFQGIADSLNITSTTSTNFTMKTTLLANNTKVRMTFDVTGTNSPDAASSAKYIEGTISASGTGSNLVYTFSNISYAGGLGSEQGAGPISGVRSGTELNFEFTGIEGYNPSTDNSKAKQWLMASGTSVWQINSEYTVTGATDTEIEALSSIIYLVLDSSTSLNATQIGQIKSAAQSFINSLYSQLAGLVPTGVSAAAVSSNSITVTWNPVSNKSNTSPTYVVYRSTSSDGTYTTIGSAYLPSWTDTGLSSGTTYYYKVAASIRESSYYNYWTTSASAYASATTK
jgi:hypothetical protein